MHRYLKKGEYEEILPVGAGEYLTLPFYHEGKVYLLYNFAGKLLKF